MNKKQIAVFKELLADPNFKGKKSLEHLLWLNTSEPKFKAGDCFKVTDHGHTIAGHPVKNFNAKIVKSYCFKTENQWYYEMEMAIEYNGKHSTSKVYKAESDLVIPCDDNKNILSK
jgi:hypothetical protein